MKDQTPVICWTDVQTRVGHHDSLLRKLARLVIQELPGRSGLLCASVADGDLAQAAKDAHKIDGALSTIGAKRAAHAAAELERTARAGDGQAVADRLPAFLEDLTAVKLELERYLNEQSTS